MSSPLLGSFNADGEKFQDVARISFEEPVEVIRHHPDHYQRWWRPMLRFF